jgi:alcohol dehydrogenase
VSDPLAERAFDLVWRDRVRFGVGSIASLGELVREQGERVFVVTDPGVRAAGVVERVVGVLDRSGLASHVFDEVEPNPSDRTVEYGARRLREFGVEGTIVVAVGGGSAMDTAKAVSLRATNDAPLWELGYDDPALEPGRPVVAVVTTAGTGAETNSFAVITDEAAGRKGYIGHPSLLPVASVLDPVLTVDLPPGATAASGIDAMTHSLESLLSAHPNPFAEAIALAVVRTVGEWLPRAVADGSDLEARSRMLMASHLAGVGQQSGTGVGLVHALGHALGTRGKLAHGTALAAVLPEVLAFYVEEPGLRDRELALVGVALRAVSPTESDETGATAAIGQVRRLCSSVGQRPTLRALGFDDATLDLVAQDAIDDAAIRNSPRLPTLAQTRAILASVAD